MSNFFNKINITSKFYVFLSIILIVAVIDTFVLAAKFQSGLPYRSFSNYVVSIETEVLKLEAYIDVYLASINVPSYSTDSVVGDIKEQSYILSKVIAGLSGPDYINVIQNNKNIAGTIKDIESHWSTIEIDLLLFYSASTQDDTYLMHNNLDLNTSLLSDDLSILELNLNELALKFADDGTRTIAFVLAMSFLFIAVCSFIFIKAAFKPLRVFKNRSDKIVAGDFSIRFDDSSYDEVGILASALNKVLDGLPRVSTINGEGRVNSLTRGDQHMAALNSIIILAGKSVSEYEFYNKAIQETMNATGAIGGAVYMVNFEKIELKVSKGFKGTFFEEASELPVEDRYEGGKLFRVSKVFTDIDMLPNTKYVSILKKQGVKSIICTPILRGDSVIGYMDTAFSDTEQVENHVPFTDAVALSIGVVVGYTELFFEAHKIRRFLERTFDQQPFGAAIFDSKGCCTMANASLKRFLGCPQGSEVVGRYKYKDDKNFSSVGFVESIDGSFKGTTGTTVLDYDSTILQGLGFLSNIKKVKVMSVPIYDSSGNIPNVMLTFTEIENSGAGNS